MDSARMEQESSSSGSSSTITNPMQGGGVGGGGGGPAPDDQQPKRPPHLSIDIPTATSVPLWARVRATSQRERGSGGAGAEGAISAARRSWARAFSLAGDSPARALRLAPRSASLACVAAGRKRLDEDGGEREGVEEELLQRLRDGFNHALMESNGDHIVRICCEFPADWKLAFS